MGEYCKDFCHDLRSIAYTARELFFGRCFSCAAPRGVDVFRHGEGGYFMFRIPAMMQLPTGELMLFAEGRKSSHRDHGWIDLVYKISSDGGLTWSELALLYGESSPGGQQITIGNAVPGVVDGRPFVAFCRDNKQVLTLHAKNKAGTEWPSEPTDITQQVLGRPSAKTWVALGPPGSLLFMVKSHRLLVPFNADGGAGSIYSDDNGKSWAASNMVQWGNECQAARLPDGKLLLNMRVSGKAPETHAGDRMLSVSTDNGATWATEGPGHWRWQLGASVCCGSMIADEKGTLFFTHPRHRRQRIDLCLWRSDDEGASWQFVRSIDHGPAAYSSLVAQANGRVAVAYEGGVSFHCCPCAVTNAAIRFTEAVRVLEC